VIAHDALEHLRASDVAIGMLPRFLRVSERQMRRTINATTGLSAKRAQRILRMTRAIVAADRVTRPDWAMIALESGFYDQPHMIDEVRDLTGATPSALHAERRAQQA
jgi:AraC-like DNA-binding protein